MNEVNTRYELGKVAHEHRGDLYLADEDSADTAARIREHLKTAFPAMQAKVRLLRGSGDGLIRVAIVRFDSADISNRDTAFAVRRLVATDLDRFVRYDWHPNHGMSRVSVHTNVYVDPAHYAAAVEDVPQLKSLMSFAEFTRTVRPGDVLEHISGKQPHLGARVTVIAISARRLTTRASDAPADARQSRVPIQGGACFTSDGDSVGFVHSGFADQGGYSLMRWIRQP